MSAIDMERLKAFFAFLFAHRLQALEATKAWRLYGAVLTAHGRTVMGWRPAEEARDDSVARALAEHRGWGRGVRRYCATVLALPEVDPRVAEAAEAVREAVRPPKHAAGAVAAFTDGEQDRAALMAHLVVLPDEVGAWFALWLASGARLEKAVAARYEAEEAARPASGLLGETVRMLGVLREALRHEGEANPALGDVETQVFEYWDHLRRRNRPGPVREGPPEVTEEVAPAPSEPPEVPEVRPRISFGTTGSD